MREPPQRRITDHFHSDVWTRIEQHRFEDKIDDDVAEIRRELRAISNRITLMLGALGLIAFLLPVVAPFVRAFLNIDVPSDR